MKFPALLSVLLTAANAIPHFFIDISLEPRKRFAQLAAFYRDELISMMEVWDHEVSNKIGRDGMQQVLHTLQWPQEYLEEMRGMVDTIQHKSVTQDILVLWNAMYELNHPTFCTGMLLAQDDGTVIHGRNMDYFFPFLNKAKGVFEDLQQVTYEATFTRGQEPLYYHIAWPGHVGTHTGMRFGGWSVNLNMRPNTYQANFGAMVMGAMSHGVLIRTVLANAENFEQAKTALYAARFAAPCYIIVAGAQPFEGSIMVMDRNGAHNPYTPPPKSLTSDVNGGWMLSQTNDDSNSAPMDIRRPVIAAEMGFMSRKMVSEKVVLRLVRTPPTFNLATKFTVVMVPKTSRHYAFLPFDQAEIPNEREEVKKQSLHKLTTGPSLRGIQRIFAPPPEYTYKQHKGPPVGVVPLDEAMKALNASLHEPGI